eukprot:m.733057 g.733057  ORF g.733057 m.733057 type:complete len:1032 (+) comp23069_c0_seq3:161-3256(+)
MSLTITQISLLVTFTSASDAANLRQLSMAYSQFESVELTNKCLDTSGGTPLLDVYDCVDPHASNAANELFNISSGKSTDGWIAPASFANHVMACISASGCGDSVSGHAPGQLCVDVDSQCDSSDKNLSWTVRSSGSPQDGTITIQADATTGMCLGVTDVVAKLVPCTSQGAKWRVRAHVEPPPPPPPVVLHIDGNAAGPSYDGHGLLSAGASSRLLIDYPEPQRSQILDYLFKPSFGASLHVLKVEIGGDIQSTSGTEQSHMHSRDDLSCTRGYEGWLLKEAKLRNPGIKTWGLSWGVPGWIGNGSYFSDDNVMYQTKWVECMHSAYNISVDYVGIWNERPYGPPSYTVALRQSLDAAGFASTKIVLPDGHIDATLVGLLDPTSSTYDPHFSDAVYAVGQHGCGHRWDGNGSFPQQKFWCTESEVSNGWPAAMGWGGTINRNFVQVNQTATTSWSLIWSVPSVVGPYQGRGAMLAAEPWSGHYRVDGTIWMYAHWTQFTEIGWKILAVATGGSGVFDDGGGTYCTIVSPDRKDVSVVLDRLHTSIDAHVTLRLSNILTGTRSLDVWSTTPDAPFAHVGTVTPGPDGRYDLTLYGNTIYTVSSVSTATHGNYSDVPLSSPMPLPYHDDFDAYATNDTLPKFFADQGGAFSVVHDATTTHARRSRRSSTGGALVQMMPASAGANAWVHDPDPATLIGDASWSNVTVRVSAMLRPPNRRTSTPDHAPSSHGRRGDGGMVEPRRARQSQTDLSGSASSIHVQACVPNSAYQQWALNVPYPGYIQNQDDHLCLNTYGCGPDSAVIEYACLPGRNAGCPGSKASSNLRWTLDLEGRLVVNSTGQCATVSSTMAGSTGAAGISMSDCLPSSSPAAASQKFKYDGVQKTLVWAGATGAPMCLGVTPQQNYVAVCGRVSKFVIFSDPTLANNGVCLKLHHSGDWSLMEWNVTLANGTVPSTPLTWRQLALVFHGTTVEASIDGVPLVSTYGTPSIVRSHITGRDVNPVDMGVPVTATSGAVTLGSGFHWAAFDNFTVIAS